LEFIDASSFESTRIMKDKTRIAFKNHLILNVMNPSLRYVRFYYKWLEEHWPKQLVDSEYHPYSKRNFKWEALKMILAS
jgi:hypothetical protein